MDKYAGAIELWQSYHIMTAADLDKYLNSFRILFAFHSGKMKNVRANLKSTIMLLDSTRPVHPQRMLKAI